MVRIHCGSAKCLHSLVVRTLGFHPSNGGSIPPGDVSECAFGPHAALAKKPEMLMYNMYIPLSELFAALPADQIHHSDPAPAF